MDSWYGVEDHVKRRRIQNRLAQRAHRNRLTTSGNTSRPKILPGHSAPCRSQHSPANPEPSTSTESEQSIQLATPSPTTDALIVSGTQYAAIPLLSIPEDCVMTNVPTAVFAALFNNGAMMGLSCSSNIPHKSLRKGPEIPLPLHPTALQMTTFHVSWIDRFPFAKMRDNLITMTGIIDEEDFLCDLFSMDSFRVKSGEPGWNPNAWIIGKEFGKKWGFLFY
ncbi:hypothetical protein LTR49_028891 [Elasticomyces elasticus]|nr:hypothetical protein LTR49_028891 [Elasticomyces elasticus]KAK5682875.1 hypothetical protein LTS12_029193 [Elasticomyces elasticus]